MRLKSEYVRRGAQPLYRSTVRAMIGADVEYGRIVTSRQQLPQERELSTYLHILVVENAHFFDDAPIVMVLIVVDSLQMGPQRCVLTQKSIALGG